MPTYREDLHLGHKVPTTETDDIVNRAVTSEKIALQAIITELLADLAVTTAKIANGAVTADKIADLAVITRKLADLAVTTEKLANGAVTTDKLANNAVQTRNIKDKNVTLPKLGDDVARELAKLQDLQDQIDSLEIYGVVVSGEFGQNEHISINQKTLTQAINRIWAKIEDMTGEALQGITMQVTPTYIISEDGCTVHIAANTVDTNGIFEKITFYGNGIKFAEAENVTEFNYDHQITETTVIRCVAKIMGIEYERQAVVTHYNSYWLGCGSNYQSVMDLAHVIPVTPGLRSVHDVTASDNDHIIIILGESLADGFIRADINGIEIPFTSQTVTVDDKNYVVYTSVNTYEAGTYNIDING